ncbi:sigma 54 modulation/S30EA ribosomal C-terminal domain-containing protein [Nocardia huaxiensis]|nr:sigma 54 modulation/S30EA ribosomal C-terminal domain-containing protein [Nocardia huaxiensis]
MGTGEVMVAEPEIEVSVSGELPPLELIRAQGVIGRTLRRHHIDGGARVRLTGGAHPGGRTVAQVNLVLDGEPVRTQIDGPGGFALTFAAERLDRQLHRLRHGAPSRWTPDPGRAPLAQVTGEGLVLHRKRCELQVCAPSVAVTVMDRMDYDAHLFTDAATGEDALVYWAGPRGVRMARQRRVHPPRELAQLPLTMNPHPTRRLTEHEAAARLCAYGLPFVFYTDAAAGRGRLLYRRYDGELGLVSAI